MNKACSQAKQYKAENLLLVSAHAAEIKAAKDLAQEVAIGNARLIEDIIASHAAASSATAKGVGAGRGP